MACLFYRPALQSLSIALWSFSLILMPGMFLAGLEAQPRAYTIENLPNPQSGAGSFLSDPDGILGAQGAGLSQELRLLEQETSAEFSIVIVNSIGETVPKDFAVALFNHWGIGKAEKDNGLLLLIVLDQRRWEFETGYGLEGVLPDATLSRIGRSILVPYLKSSQYATGLKSVIAEIGVILRKYAPEIKAGKRPVLSRLDRMDPMFATNLAETRKARRIFGWASVLILSFASIFFAVMRRRAWKRKSIPPDQKNSKGQDLVLWPLPLYIWLPLALFWPAMGLLVIYWHNFTIAFIAQFGGFIDSTLGFWLAGAGYLWLAFVTFLSRWRRFNALLKINSAALDQGYNLARSYLASFLPGLIFFPWLFVPLHLLLRRRLSSVRKSARVCTVCSQSMDLLGENAEDPHLDKGQLQEEILQSVDYDVWLCPKDNTVSLIAYNNPSTKFQKCDFCGYITAFVASVRTVKAPGYENTGTGIAEIQCNFCRKKKEKETVIPKLVRSSSGSSSGRSGSSSYSSSSSSGGSSGSFGGGRSGGGGAGGSW